MSRYKIMFDRLTSASERALISFFMLGYPDRKSCLAFVDAAIQSGADALELGIPYSDPVADGPTIVEAANIARDNGATVADCFVMMGEIRAKHPQIPLGLLVYANFVFAAGADQFLISCQRAGVDSLLVADLPLREAENLRMLAADLDVKIVLILPPNVTDEQALRIGKASQGYVYLLSRFGVTGTETPLHTDVTRFLPALSQAGAPPGILGFGISSARQVRLAVDAGVAGVIVGSGLVKNIQQTHGETQSLREKVMSDYIADLKRETVVNRADN